jgi:hypothetical protein
MRAVDLWAKLCNNYIKERFVSERERRRSWALCSSLLFFVRALRMFRCFSQKDRRGCDVDVSLPQLTLRPERYKGKTFGIMKMAFSLPEVKSMAEQRGVA